MCVCVCLPVIPVYAILLRHKVNFFYINIERTAVFLSKRGNQLYSDNGGYTMYSNTCHLVVHLENWHVKCDMYAQKPIPHS